MRARGCAGAAVDLDGAAALAGVGGAQLSASVGEVEYLLDAHGSAACDLPYEPLLLLGQAAERPGAVLDAGAGDVCCWV